MSKFSLIGAWMVVCSLLLSACGSGRSDKATLAPEAIFTSAAQTAEARRIERFAQTATQPVQALIETSAFESPTATLFPSETPSIQGTPTGGVPEASQPAEGGERGEFVADVSIPDGTVLAPNQSFQKTWRIMNTGQTTWTPDYALIFIDGELMGAQPTVALPTSVAPGEKVEIAVDMVAPPNPGAYRGYWELRNATGQIFGFGANADESIWVDIAVQGEAAAGSQTTTPAAGGAIASLSLSVDNPDVSDECPHTFVFTARITLTEPTRLAYLLEGGSLSGEEIHLPSPAANNFTAGEHPVVYELTVPAGMTAWARFHVTDPGNAFSNQVDFSLTCG